MPHYLDTGSEAQDVETRSFDQVTDLVAARRVRNRPRSPGVKLQPNDDHAYDFTPPGNDMAAWEVQISDAFGAAGPTSAKAFLFQLTSLCSLNWDADNGRWKPSETQLNFALSFINNIQPRNQAEAALAAQMVAVHLMQMRVSAQALTSGQNVDPRDAAIAGKLARTFTMQMDTLRRMRGRGTARQNIRVKKEIHQHVHYHAPGGAEGNAGQSHAKPAVSDQRAALSGNDEGGQVVPLTRRARKAGV